MTESAAIEDMADRGRLAKLVGMLGSAHEGERANALDMVGAELKRSGLTWSWLVLLIEHGELPGAGERALIFRRLICERLQEGLRASFAMGDGEARFIRKVLVDCETGVGGIEARDLRKAIDSSDAAIRRAGQRTLRAGGR
jgi:hypothetical protein